MQTRFSDLSGALYFPIEEQKIDLTLLPVWLIAVTCIGIGSFLSGIEHSNQKTKVRSTSSGDIEGSRIIQEDSDDRLVMDDEQQINAKQILGKS